MQSLNNESNPKQAQTRFWCSNHVFFYQREKVIQRRLISLKEKNRFFSNSTIFFFYSEKELIHSTVIRQIGELN
jgi:hypothetical protein